MKRVWLVAKVAVLVAASYCIFTPGGTQALPNVRAEGCNTSDACWRNTTNNSCYCSVTVIGGQGCSGCFTKNNDTGCGSCSNGGGGGELD